MVESLKGHQLASPVIPSRPAPPSCNKGWAKSVESCGVICWAAAMTSAGLSPILAAKGCCANPGVMVWADPGGMGKLGEQKL